MNWEVQAKAVVFEGCDGGGDITDFGDRPIETQEIEERVEMPGIWRSRASETTS